MWSGQIRDPDRIDRILKKLETYWKQKNHTDLRLTQIIVNMTNTKRNSDIFYIEDDIVEKMLDEAILNNVCDNEDIASLTEDYEI